jgi:hypothetical protein
VLLNMREKKVDVTVYSFNNIFFLNRYKIYFLIF